MIHDEIEYHLASVTKMVWSIQNCWVKTIQESFGFHLKRRSIRKKHALMYQKSLQKGRTSLSTGRGWLLATPPSCVSSARLTEPGRSSVRFYGTMNATRQVWRRFVGSVAGWFSFGSNEWAGKASRVTCTLWSCTKKLLFARIRFFLFWMAVFWVAMFWIWLPKFNNTFWVFRIFFLLVWSPTKFQSEMRLHFERLLYQVSFSGLRNSWAFTKSQRRIYIRSRQDMRSFSLPTQNCFRLAG